MRAPNFAVQNADLVIAIGARLDNVVTAHNPAKFGRHAQKIVVDVDAAELAKFPENAGFALSDRGRRAGLHRTPPAEGACGRADRPVRMARALCRLEASLSDQRRRPLPDEGPDRPLPPDADAVRGASRRTASSSPEAQGLAVEFFHTGFQNKEGQRVFLTSGLGAMGYGLPAMIGAYMASDRRPFVGIESDGSLMMNVQELQTIASLGMPVRMFVFNNNGYASIRTTQRTYFEGRYVGSGPQAKLEIPDLVALARTFGWDAFAISDVADLRDGIRRALDHKGPLLVDVRVLETEALFPKSAALPQADGSMRSMPLEDMSPLLPRDEFRANMIVPLDPASESVPEHLIVRRDRA